MSTVEIYAVDPKGDVGFYDEVRNSHGGAIWIWRHLGADYEVPFDLFNDWAFQRFFERMHALCAAGVVSDADALVFLISCDWGIIPGELLATAADALQAFYKRHPHPTGDGIEVVLRRAHWDPDVAGICFNHTSVVADPIWRNWQHWDEEEASDPPPYNIHTHDDGHWFIPYPYPKEESRES